MHPAERGFHGLQQDWWWTNHHDRVNVRTQGPSKPFYEANEKWPTHFNLVIDKIDRFYAASKFAVTGLLEGWRQELRDIGGNIRVCGISPGAPHYTLDQWQFSVSRLGPDRVPGRHVPGQPGQGGRHPQQRALPPVWGHFRGSKLHPRLSPSHAG